MDPFTLVTGSIGAVAAIAPIYDACRRLYDTCKGMYLCGKSVVTLWGHLLAQYLIFKNVMSTKLEHIRLESTVRDEYGDLTDGILAQLSIIQTHLEKCVKLAQRYLTEESKHSGAATPPKITGQAATPSSNTSQSLTAHNSPISTPDAKLEALRTSIIFGHFDGQEIHRKDAGVAKTQKHLNVILRARFALVDETALSDSVTQIRKAVKTLRTLIKLKDPQDPTPLIPGADAAASPNLDDSEVQKCLISLQRAFRSVNRRSPTHHEIDCAVDCNPIGDWEVINDRYEEMPLHEGAGGVIFRLQDSTSATADESTLLLVESLRHPERTTAESELALPLLKSWEDVQTTTASTDSEEPFHCVGDLADPRPGNGNGRHRLFAGVQHFHKLRSLGDYVCDGTFDRTTISPTSLAKLVMDILRSHALLSPTRKSTRNPRLTDFVYYEDIRRLSQYNFHPKPPIPWQSPYVSCDFAHPQPRVGLDTSFSQLTKHPDASIIELGLVIYEICTLNRVEYQPSTSLSLGSSLEEAKIKALDDLEHLDSLLSQILEACLRGTAKSEQSIVSHAVSRLQRHVGELSDRIVTT